MPADPAIQEDPAGVKAADGEVYKPSVSLWLDGFDDLFSDFDPRPYEDKALSEDFLREVRRFTLENPGGRTELRLLLPAGRRDAVKERVVTKRLHDYFRKQYVSTNRELKKTVQSALVTIALGMSLMLAASYISAVKSQELLTNLLFVVIEPAGWFITWFSLDKLFYGSKQKKPDLEFYRKLWRCKISFGSY